MAATKGIDLCQKYFYSTFEDRGDAEMFSLRVVGAELEQQYVGLSYCRAGWCTVENESTTDRTPRSFFAYEGSTQLLPAVVMVQSCEPRKNLYKHSHHFLLQWILNGQCLAILRVDPKQDGTHPLAQMNIRNGELHLILK